MTFSIVRPALALVALSLTAAGCGESGSLASVADATWEIDVGASPYDTWLNTGSGGSLDPFSGPNANLPAPQFAIAMGPDQVDCPDIDGVTGTVNGREASVEQQLRNASITIDVCYRLDLSHDFERQEVLDLAADNGTVDIVLTDDTTTLAFAVKPFFSRPIALHPVGEPDTEVNTIGRGEPLVVDVAAFTAPPGVTVTTENRPSTEIGTVAPDGTFSLPEEAATGTSELWAVTRVDHEPDGVSEDPVVGCGAGACRLESTLEIGHRVVQVD